jgi:hypothetical protein
VTREVPTPVIIRFYDCDTGGIEYPVHTRTSYVHMDANFVFAGN